MKILIIWLMIVTLTTQIFSLQKTAYSGKFPKKLQYFILKKNDTKDFDLVEYSNSISKNKQKHNSFKVNNKKIMKKKRGKIKYSRCSKKKVIPYAKKLLGVKYVWGGITRKGLDCSGFTKKVFKETKNINLPRTSSEQFRVGKPVKKGLEKKGDLIFFSDSKRYVGHVGIILDPKKKLMIHASSGAKRVVITSYNKKYYRKHFRGIRRV